MQPDLVLTVLETRILDRLVPDSKGNLPIPMHSYDRIENGG